MGLGILEATLWDSNGAVAWHCSQAIRFLPLPEGHGDRDHFGQGHGYDAPSFDAPDDDDEETFAAIMQARYDMRCNYCYRPYFVACGAKLLFRMYHAQPSR